MQFLSMVGPIRRSGPASLLVPLAGIALLIGSGAARAQPDYEVHTATVSYADLDVSSPADAELLHHRIRLAARTVCGWEDKHRLIARDAWRECYHGAVSDALAMLQQRIPEAVLEPAN